MGTKKRLILRTTLLLAIVTSLFAAGASARAAAAFSWRAPARVDPAALSDVSCPSASFCAAVDMNGDVVTTTNPSGGAAAWKLVNVDGAVPMNGISCPTASLCVAVGMDGNVVSSSDPTGGASAWSVANVEPAPGGGGAWLEAVACPSSSFCVVVDQSGNAVVSSAPTGGPAAWTVQHVDPSTYLCGDHYDEVCQEALSDIACSSASHCAAFDNGGNAVTSTDPTGGPGAWHVDNVDNSGFPYENGPTCSQGLCLALSCPTDSFCAAAGSDGNVLTSSDPPAGPSAWSKQGVSAQTSLSDISCSSSTWCAAVDWAGNALTTTSPTGGANAWTTSFIDPGNTHPTGDTPDLSGISCPSATLCVAVDDVGNVIVGTLPPTTAAIRHDLLAALKKGPRSIHTLLRHHGYSFTASSPYPGRLTIDWSLRPTPKRQRILIASGRAQFQSPGPTHVKLTLTRTGRVLLRRLRHVRVTATGKVTPTGAAPVGSEHRLRLSS